MRQLLAQSSHPGIEPARVKQKARIVNAASKNSLFGLEGHAAYAASKHAVEVRNEVCCFRRKEALVEGECG
jgi:NAD(P)-dependent dehydrogenase (short-subunit alcohol dehydrogenase family)